MEHLLYGCTVVNSIDHPDIVASNSLVRAALAGAAEHPAYWLRGLLPRAMVSIPRPSRLLFLSMVSGRIPAPASQEKWPEGTYYTDGSGGPFSSVPLLRRCAVGVARISVQEQGLSFDWGAHSNLPTNSQSEHTICRAELFCWILVASRAPRGCIEIISDSWTNIQIYRKQQDAGGVAPLEHDNSDLWRVLCHLLHQRSGGIASFSVKWVKSHLVEAAGPVTRNRLQSFSRKLILVL